MKRRNQATCFFLLFFFSVCAVRAQYVQPERDDTIRIYAKTPFDTLAARAALAEGNGTIKGVAFTRAKNNKMAITGQKLYANKMTVILFPVTPYLEEYLDLKKKENPKKLKYVYIDPNAWRFRLTAVTNSTGEFTFPKMKPGKYYLEGILNWNTSGYYNQYTGSGYGYGGTTDYYERKYYTVEHADKLYKYVEVTKDGEVVEVKLK
ncbi:carboxypeptidase-like regulatory domain-containing protein [Deminuibacter soli]|uniref:Carboxypeptidase regulatory-like domain-containing protein n=1 Tax=Deminuibacter soli TaxID=2291815 RepID=A0A3E1NGH8_9BACT|nr:carboxypeptidase-like regulatory domain-containing protein [Deminuibacter soli]RFM26982.1 carboxypeptidase regulatory-like domain-containing protein [Deminuibacter soli]